MATAKQITLSGTITATSSFVFVDIAAPASGRVFKVVPLLLDLSLSGSRDGGNNVATASWEFDLNSLVVFAGTVPGVGATAVGTLLSTTSGGSIPYSLLTHTRNSDGAIQVSKVNTTTAFYNTDVTSPVVDRSSFSAPAAPFLDGLSFPLHVNGAEKLRLGFKAASVAGGAGALRYLIVANIFADNLEA